MKDNFRKHGGRQLKIMIDPAGNRGSSSVLVILIMVTIVVLGLLTMMSTYSDLKLSRKNADWTRGYYTLDAKAENKLAEMDATLKEAAAEAEAYIQSKKYETASGGQLPAGFQTLVNEGWNNARANGGGQKYLEGLRQKLYCMFAVKAFENRADPLIKVNARSDIFNDPGLPGEGSISDEDAAVEVSATVSDGEGDSERSLKVDIALVPPGSGGSGENKRYRIVSWKELSKNFKYQDALEFEDPGIEVEVQ